MNKNWGVIIITIIMIVLIYNFLTGIFKSDQKRFSHDRIYVDYSDYRHEAKDSTTTSTTAVARHPAAFKAAREAREIKKTMFKNVMTATISSYNSHMNEALKDRPSPQQDLPKPQKNAQFEQLLTLANTNVPAYQSGMHFFTSGDFTKAIERFSHALESLDPMDIKNRIDCYSMLAESYLRQNNEDGYVQNKIRQIRMERRLKSILTSVFPDQPDSFGRLDWMSTREASQRLLRLRSAAARSSAPHMNQMIKRAELDLEVARRVSQIH